MSVKYDMNVFRQAKEAVADRDRQFLQRMSDIGALWKGESMSKPKNMVSTVTDDLIAEMRDALIDFVTVTKELRDEIGELRKLLHEMVYDDGDSDEGEGDGHSGS